MTLYPCVPARTTTSIQATEARYRLAIWPGGPYGTRYAVWDTASNERMCAWDYRRAWMEELTRSLNTASENLAVAV
jgi:hypothetical protein